MANLSHSESRRLYSWWWDSHNSPKNSKWLMDNLTDMDVKVKSMIKLIEEDADSFARRAEMYYKKRPELMKLVEEFYRAYRALAERYNHATGELRHAHRTIAKAFPDKDSPTQNGPHTPDIKCTARVLSFDSDDDEGDSEVGPGKTGSNGFENEARFLRKALADMKAEKDEVLMKYQNCLSKLSNIERELDNAEKDSITLNEKANKAEIEVENLKENLVRLDAAKNAGLEKISSLESIISRETKIETRTLKDEISRLEVEKQRVVFENKDFLEKISVLENVISVMENEARLLKIQAEESENEIVELKKSIADLNNEKEKSALKYKCCLETISKLEKDLSNAKMDVKRLTNDVSVQNSKFDVLEMSNSSLRAEANNLAEKIITKDRELSEKLDELENLERNLRDEHLKYAQIAADLDSLQNVHSKSRDDQRDLEMELKNALRMLNASEISKNEAQISMENMQNEITSLKEIKERLENKVSHHIGLNDSLQNEILRLKDEIERLSESYGDLIEQIEQSGLDPKCLGFSLKNLHDENSKMKQKYEDEKMVLIEKVFGMSNLNAELENSREKVESLRESCEFLNDEKRALISEKASYMSQLHVITENLHDLLGKNAVLENCLSTARVELEGLREKSKGLEEICELLKDERSYLLSEKRGLVLKLENVERKLEITEKRFTGLEEKYADLENEKKAADCELKELKFDRKNYDIQNKSILIGLENQIRVLKEENGSKTKEYEEELEKGLKAQFEISILQKFMKDFEEKNYALIIECQKHVEASKLSEKVISELESESLEQQVEAEMLLDEIERLRRGIYEVIRAVDPDCDPVVENEGTFVNHVVGKIQDMKSSVSKIGNLEREFEMMAKNLDLAKNEKDEALETNERLRSNLIESNRRADLLESELTNLKRDNGILLKKFSDVKEENYIVNQQNDAILLEFLATDNKSIILTRFGEEKVIEMKLLLEDLNKQHKDNISLEHEIKVVRENLEVQKAQTLLLRDAVRKSEIEMQKTREYNVRMKRNLLQTQAKLMQTESKLESSEHLRENLEKNIIELSENNSIQKREIEGLSTVNANLQSKLEAKNDEFEAFYFNSQISSIREVMYKNKLKEVSGACRNLENESASKTLEIEQMKSKMKELKSKINAYDPVVAGLRDDITLLEQNAILQAKLKAARNRNQELELLEVSDDLKTRTSDIIHEDPSFITLKNLHARIKSVGKMIEESNKPASRRRSNAKKHESINVEIEHLKTRRFLGRKKPHANEDTPKVHKIKTKDIPLDHVSNNANVGVEKDDQMLELWEIGAKNRRTIGDSIRVSYRMIENDGFENLKRIPSPPSTDPDLDKDLGFDMSEISSRISEANKEVNKRRVLERLTSDAQKLENLQTNVEILKTKLETCKKDKNVDFETVQEQLLEIEETVVNLTYTNGQLVRKLQECPSPGGRVSPRRRKVVEQARKGSERIARLELEFQKIQFIVMKMEDDKKKKKGKIKFLRNKSVVLRDFIYNGKRVNSVKGKKGPLCGCLKPSTSRNGFSSPY